MNFGSIFQKLFGTTGVAAEQGGPATFDMLARSFHDANQSGATDGSNMADMARLWDSSRTAPPPPAAQQPQPQPALAVSPTAQDVSPAAQGVSPATMQLIAPPQAGNFNITAPTGTKPKNYVPASMSMDVPMPSALARLGLLPQRASPFQITPPSGTKPKNYVPARMTMNAPSPVGPGALQQILAMMGPRSPFGTRRG